MQIRHATPSDAQGILEAHYSAVHETSAQDYSPEITARWSAPVTPERIQNYITQSLPGETTLVAIVDHQIAGFGAIVEAQNDLRALYVSAKYARLGVGQRLLQELEALAQQRGCTELRMDSSLTAAPFYARRGYREISRGIHVLSDGLKMDCVRMHKHLLVGVDKDGLIVTEVAANQILPPFKEIVSEAIDALKTKFSSYLDSIYVYGSVATGKAVVGKSDLDMIVVFRESPDQHVTQQLVEIETKLSLKHAQTFRGISLAPTTVDAIQSESERFGAMCFLKHLCVCIDGIDLARDTPRFKPSAEVARAFNGDITQSLKNSRSFITGSDSAIEARTQAIAKKIVRTAFTLVMPRAQAWTTDLNLASQIFSTYYPDKSGQIGEALQMCVTPTADQQVALDLIDNFGNWLANEFERVIGKKT